MYDISGPTCTSVSISKPKLEKLDPDCYPLTGSAGKKGKKKKSRKKKTKNDRKKEKPKQ